MNRTIRCLHRQLSESLPTFYDRKISKTSWTSLPIRKRGSVSGDFKSVAVLRTTALIFKRFEGFSYCDLRERLTSKLFSKTYKKKKHRFWNRNKPDSEFTFLRYDIIETQPLLATLLLRASQPFMETTVLVKIKKRKKNKRNGARKRRKSKAKGGSLNEKEKEKKMGSWWKEGGRFRWAWRSSWRRETCLQPLHAH